MPNRSIRVKLSWIERRWNQGRGEKCLTLNGIFTFPRYCDKLGLKTAFHKVTAKQFQANIRGKNKSSSATCLLSTHINPKWPCLHKIIDYKSSKVDIKKERREKSRLMLPYRVISVDACLIRLTTATDSEHIQRSISLGST